MGKPVNSPGARTAWPSCTPSILMTSGYKVSLWKPGGSPTPLCTTGRLGGKKENRPEKKRVKVRQIEKSQRKEVVNESQKDKEGEERGEPKRQGEKESVRVGLCALQRHW